jgi:hypothetical protein
VDDVEAVALAPLQCDGEILLKAEKELSRIHGDEWSLAPARDEKSRGVRVFANGVVQSRRCYMPLKLAIIQC